MTATIKSEATQLEPFRLESQVIVANNFVADRNCRPARRGVGRGCRQCATLSVPIVGKDLRQRKIAVLSRKRTERPRW
jgi:hypothetical protein